VRDLFSLLVLYTTWPFLLFRDPDSLGRAVGRVCGSIPSCPFYHRAHPSFPCFSLFFCGFLCQVTGTFRTNLFAARSFLFYIPSGSTIPSPPRCRFRDYLLLRERTRDFFFSSTYDPPLFHSKKFSPPSPNGAHTLPLPFSLEGDVQLSRARPGASLSRSFSPRSGWNVFFQVALHLFLLPRDIPPRDLQASFF